MARFTSQSVTYTSAIQFLDAHETYEDFIAEHPTGEAGDAHLVGTHLYSWNPETEEWIDAGEWVGPQGETGPQGIQGETGPTGASGEASAVATIYAVEGGTTGTQPTFNGDPLFTGQYIRFGDLVHFDIQVDMDNIEGFGSGQYYVTLPFNAASAYLFREGCLHDADGEQYHVSGHVAANEKNLYLFTTDQQGNRLYDFAFQQGEPITLNSADNFHIAGTYIADLT